MLKTIYNKLNYLEYQMGIGKFSSLLKLNKQLKNAAVSEKRCFILATGPSIKSMDLSPLESEFCISVSNFFVHPLFSKIKPRYHVFAGTHPPLTNEHIGNWWKDATASLTGNIQTRVLLNANDKKIKDQFEVFSNQQVFYYWGNGKFPVEFTKQIPAIQTVVHIALYLAMYLGIKEIYLLGCDHSWINHYRESMHFYHESQHSFTRNNYSEWSEIKDMGEEFKSYANLWDIYRNIRTEAISLNVGIYNATPGSLLDIFPRKEFAAIHNPATING